jgi:hypothetical protein
MKLDPIRCLCVFSLVCGLLAGCATNSSGPATVDATQKKGHWITLPPETGSNIPRRVWVEDNGQTGGSPSVNNVGSGSVQDLQKIQSNSRLGRPPGS